MANIVKRKSAIAFALMASAVSAPVHAAGVLIASGDEWQLSNSAYQTPYLPGTTGFANSIAATFGGNNYLLLTGNSNVSQTALSSFAAQLQSLGKTVSYAGSLPSSLAGYDAVFHFGQAISSTSQLQSYVTGGGNLYVSLGGGWYGSAAAEANFWNPFLANYGLTAGSNWFTVAGFDNVTVTSGPAGVSNLIWGYGQSIEAISGSAGVSYLRGTPTGGPINIGLIGTSRALVTGAVPEPATWATMLAGFAVMGFAMRKQKQAVRVRFAMG